MNAKNQHIKLSEMASILSRSAKQFRKDVEIYNIPFIKLGRTLLFDADKVNAYLYEQTAKLQKKASKIEEIPSLKYTSKDPAHKNSGDDSVERFKSLLGLE